MDREEEKEDNLCLVTKISMGNSNKTVGPVNLLAKFYAVGNHAVFVGGHVVARISVYKVYT